MIYIIRHLNAGPVKIGYCGLERLSARLSNLKHLYGIELKPIRVFENGLHWHERWIHQKFLVNRIRGEWFNHHPSMMTVELPPPDDDMFVRPVGMTYPRRNGPPVDHAEEIRALIMASQLNGP